MPDEAASPLSGFLTSDNQHLSRPTMAQFGVSISAINCTHSLPDAVASYVCDSLSSNTRRAYLSDLAEFERWGGSIPASIETVAAYLAARAGYNTFSTFQKVGMPASAQLRPNRQAVEFSVGYRLSRRQLLKVGYEWLHTNGALDTRNNIFGVQYVTSIDSLYRAFR